MSRITKRMLLLVLLLAPMFAMSQVMVEQLALETGVDSTKWRTLPADTAITKTILTSGGDSRASSVMNIGFDFMFGGVSYSQFSSNTDGNLRLGSVVTGTGAYNQPFGDYNLGDNLPKINGMGCDGKMTANGYVKYAVLDNAPNRVLVVEYRTAKYSGSSTSDLVWQVQLFETSNEIQLVYGSETSSNMPSRFQIGMASSLTDVITVNTSTGTIRSGSTDENSSIWPAPNTFYRFYAPTCIKPSGLAIVGQTSRSVDVSWSGLEGQSSWQYVCVQSDSETVDWNDAVTVNATTATIAGLQPNTLYDVYVRTSCGADDVSDAVVISVRTNCETLNVPYFTSFETDTPSNVPNCWMSNTGESVVRMTSPYASVPYSYSGLNYLEVNSFDVVVAPRVKLAANEMMLVAYIKSSSANIGNLEVGYVSNLGLMDFTPVDTISTINDSYQEYTINYNILERTDTVNIAFRYNDDSYSSYYIDDLSIVRTTSCSRPAYAYVRNITHNGAVVEWDANDNAVSYEVAYGLSDSVEYAIVETVEGGINSLELVNLESDSTYYVWVRCICDVDTSLWRSAGSFATEASCADLIDVAVTSVSYTSAAISWEVETSFGEPTTSIELSYKRVSDAQWSTPVVLNDQNYYILQGLESASSYEVRLRARCGEDSANYSTVRLATLACSTEIVGNGSDNTSKLPFGGYYSYVYSQMLYPTADLTGIDTIKGIAFHIFSSGDDQRLVDVYMGNVAQSTLNENSRVQVSQMSLVASNIMVTTDPGWVSIMFDEEFVYDGTSNLVIAVDDNTGSYEGPIMVYTRTSGQSIYKGADWSNPNPADTTEMSMRQFLGTPEIAFLGNCSEAITCAAPVVAFGDITATSIILNWEPGVSETQWVVDYKVADSANWISNTTTAHTYTLSELNAGTLYDIRIGALCNGDTLFTNIQAFTDCIATGVPFVENFNDAALPCWVWGNIPGLAGELSWDSSTEMLEFGYDAGAYIITPELSQDINTLQVSFMAGASSSWYDGSITVSVGNDPNNYYSFVPIDTLTFTGGEALSTQLVSFANYDGTAHYIMFSSLTGITYLDNISVEAIPMCSMPTDLVVSNIGSNTATLSWTDNGTMVEKWIVSYIKAGAATPIDVEVVADDGPIYNFIGLEGNTTYTVSVTTVCTSGDSNVTLYPVTFRTECAEVVLPYTEGFEGIPSEGFHQCWYRDVPISISGPEIDAWYFEVPSVYIGEGSSSTMLLSANKKIISPRIPIPANKISVNFNMRAQDTVNAGTILVGFSPIANSDSSMIVLDTIDVNDNNWNNYTVDFNTLTTIDTGYVVFKNVGNDSVWSFDYYAWDYSVIWLDDLNFSTYSTCVRPTQSSMANITATSVDVTIVDPANTGNYSIAWNTVNNVNTATVLNTQSLATTINNLLPSTSYYLWVRSNCSDTEHSAWVLIGLFKTDCLPIAIPYTENFDDYSYGVGSGNNTPDDYPNHTIPNCWNIIGLNPAGMPMAMISNYPYYAISGPNVLFAQTAPDDPIYMIMPQFTPSTDSLMLTFSYRNSDASGRLHEFVLGVMTDPRDTSTFILLEDIPTKTEATTVEHIFALDEAVLPNTNYYIVFRTGGCGSYAQDLAIDDISVMYAPNCYRPEGMTVASIDATTATVDWVGNATNYQVQYRAVAATDWTTTIVNAATISLTNLTINTDYEIQVRGICGVGDTSLWSNLYTFTTLCSSVNIPWSENFEGYANVAHSSYGRPDSYPNQELPECWVFSEMSQSDYGGPAIWLTSQANSSWSPYNTIDGVSLRMVSNREKHTYAILPKMNADIDTLALYFEYAMPTYAEPIQIGVVTNPYDFSTYVCLDSFAVSSSARFAEHYFVYDNLDATQNYYITFKTGNSSSDGTVIDNIRVEYMPSCIRPSSVTTYSVMNSTAIVKWNTTSSSSEVKYHITGDANWMDTIVNVDTIQLTNLTGNTNYEVVVRGICGVGDTSIWSDTISFLTACDAYALPFSEDFSTVDGIGDLDCWDIYKGLVDSVMAGSESLVEDDSYLKWDIMDDLTEPLQSKHLYLDIYGDNCAKWIVSPLLNMTANVTLSFDVAFSDYYDHIDATDYADDRFYVLVTPDNGTTWEKLVTWGSDSTDTYPMDSLSLEGDSIGVSLDQYIGQSIRIAFYGESTVSGGDNNLHIDNIYVDGIPCLTPQNLSITAAAVSVTLTWEGDSQDYEVAIRESGAEWGDTVAVTGLTHTFTGLTPEMNYEYRIRQICAVDMCSEWVEGAFTTLALPCEIPVVTISDITGDGATFTWADGENNESWEVNVFNMMINESFDVNTPTYTITGLAHASEYSVAVRAKCAENVYSEWSDTVEFTTLDCYPVTGVAASDITKNSAVITWTPGGDELEWIINYGDYGFLQGQGVFDTISSTTYTIIGLAPESDYDVYVRAVCGEDFTSSWSTPVCQFQTLVDDVEGIDGVEGQFSFVIYPNPTSGATTISLNGVEGEVTISVVDMNGRTIVSEGMECGNDCEKRLDVTDLSQGTYFVRVLGDNINSVRKLIVR